jgi:predicted negative regulator of RcsB-dependent stress response
VLVLAAALLVAYGGLAAVSASQQTDRARLADLADLASYAPIETRGADADPLAARLDAALDGVEEARRTTLGLFPRFDSARLDAAAVDLAGISSAADPGSSVSQEARFALARVRLHQSRDDEAVRLLAGLVREQSYRAAEARRLLDAIRTAPGA